MRTLPNARPPGDETILELEPPSAALFAERVSRTLERLPWLVCHDADEMLGYAYAAPHRDRAAYQWSVEVSAYVGSGMSRGGIGRRLYDALFEILVNQGYFNAVAGITLPNEPSVRFHEAMGFRAVGVYHCIGFKHGRWHDVVWFERPLQPRHTPTSAPVPFAEIAGSLTTFVTRSSRLPPARLPPAFQTRIIIGSSMNPRSVCRKRAPVAPSITR
ncbi:MAG: GNAT family N-acetyltransferase [Longimicrobiales bacterium]